MKQDMIVILDLGSTENTVIARQIRDMGVYTEIHPHDITVDELKKLTNVKGIIINGGVNRVVDGAAVEVLPEIYDCGYPVMAIDHPTAKCEAAYDEIPSDLGFKNFQLCKCGMRVDFFGQLYGIGQYRLQNRQIGVVVGGVGGGDGAM